MIELTGKSGKKIMVNPEQVTMIETEHYTTGEVTKIYFTNGSVIVQEDVMLVMQMIVNHRFGLYGGDSNG